MKKTYYATVGGFINGAVRRPGDPVGKMTENEAKYLIMSGLISAQAPKATKAPEPVKRAEPDPTTLGKKTR